jgi:hypothetical protein
MTATEPTQPLTEDPLTGMRRRLDAYSGPDHYRYTVDGIEYDGHWAHDARRALAEVDRLRAENTAQAAQVAVARSELQRCMGRLEPYARQLKASGNTDAGIPIRIAVGVLRLAQERIDEADPSALDQSGEGQANG